MGEWYNGQLAVAIHFESRLEVICEYWFGIFYDANYTPMNYLDYFFKPYIQVDNATSEDVIIDPAPEASPVAWW